LYWLPIAVAPLASQVQFSSEYAPADELPKLDIRKRLRQLEANQEGMQSMFVEPNDQYGPGARYEPDYPAITCTSR
jgi:hypothetical protein